MTRPDLDSTISVAALVPYEPGTTPSQRFRIEQWRPYLAKGGVNVEVLPFAGIELTELLPCPGQVLRKAVLTMAAFGRRARLVGAMPKDRVVFVHRAACLAGPPVFERVLVRRGHPVIYDFDDAIYVLHTAAANRALAWLKQPGKTATLCRLSQHVVVGNNYLADWARNHSTHVTVVPTSVDTERCRPRAAHASGGRVIVGWTGSSTSQTYLEAFAPMLQTLQSAHDVELRVLSTREPSLPGVRHVWRRWSAETEVEEVAAFDIGIMPMPDEPWALGKCALKALQYMAAAVPTVASAVGANRDVIKHGRNGFLATRTEDWLECLRILIENRALRLELGAAGRKTVEEGYSMRKSAAKLEGVLREVARHQQDGQ